MHQADRAEVDVEPSRFLAAPILVSLSCQESQNLLTDGYGEFQNLSASCLPPYVNLSIPLLPRGKPGSVQTSIWAEWTMELPSTPKSPDVGRFWKPGRLLG